MMVVKEKKGGKKMDKFIYEGICCCCFEPILAGEGVTFRDRGRKFHQGCALLGGYYVRLEKREAEKKTRKEAAEGFEMPIKRES